jgi:co-chaperonin GroES (HSP10)
MKVLGKRVLVIEEKTEERKSQGGIILTSDDRSSYTTPKESKVLAVGDEVTNIKEGDTVLHMPKSGVHIDKEDCVWRFLNLDDVIAVMND